MARMARPVKIVCDIPGAPLLVLRCTEDEASYSIAHRPDIRPVENRMGRVVGMRHIGEPIVSVSMRSFVLVDGAKVTRSRGRETIRVVSRKLRRKE